MVIPKKIIIKVARKESFFILVYDRLCFFAGETLKINCYVIFYDFQNTVLLFHTFLSALLPGREEVKSRPEIESEGILTT